MRCSPPFPSSLHALQCMYVRYDNCVCRDISALDPGPPSSLPTNPDTKVDISSLTWEDKERVLRLLFAKINNVQVCTRSLQ